MSCDDSTSESLHVRIAVLEVQLENQKDATRLQAAEYERRLGELNHAHAMADADKAKFLTAELFWAKVEDTQKWRAEVDRWRSKILGIVIGVCLASGLAGGGRYGRCHQVFPVMW